MPPPGQEGRPGQATEADHEQGASLSLILSDQLESHPSFVRLGILAGQRNDLINEVLGFLIRCLCRGAISNARTHITRPVAETFGHERADMLLDLATDAGLLEAWRDDDGDPVWALDPQDSPLVWQRGGGASCHG